MVVTVFEIALCLFGIVLYHFVWFSIGYIHGRFVERDKQIDKQINREIKENIYERNRSKGQN